MLHSVEIDGVTYVPVTEAQSNIKTVIRALLESFWGGVPKDFDWDYYCEYISIWVNDSGEGIPINEFVSILSRCIAEEEQV